MKHHLYSNQCHDESEVWCDAQPYWIANESDAVGDVDKVTCHACLDAVMAYAGKAVNRKLNMSDESDAKAALLDACNALERWIEEKHRHDPDWPGYTYAIVNLASLRERGR